MNYTDINTINTFKQKLLDIKSNNQKVLILTHMSPDPDALGSSLGLCIGLEGMGISCDIACKDAMPIKWQFIERAKHYKTSFMSSDYNMIIWTDCGDKARTGLVDDYPEIHTDAFYKVNIDHHHKSNDLWADINIVPDNAMSCAQIVYEVLLEMHCKISRDCATALLMGIITDTGRYQHKGTGVLELECASKLLSLGADMRSINRYIMNTYTYPQVKLWGRILDNLNITEDNAAVVGVLQDDFNETGTTRDDFMYLKDMMSGIKEARYSVLLSEDEDGNVRTSLRTTDDSLDMQQLAAQFGGGGHIKASGFMVKNGSLKREVKWKIVQKEE